MPYKEQQSLLMGKLGWMEGFNTLEVPNPSCRVSIQWFDQSAPYEEPLAATGLLYIMDVQWEKALRGKRNSSSSRRSSCSISYIRAGEYSSPKEEKGMPMKAFLGGKRCYCFSTNWLRCLALPYCWSDWSRLAHDRWFNHLPSIFLKVPAVFKSVLAHQVFRVKSKVEAD